MQTTSRQTDEFAHAAKLRVCLRAGYSTNKTCFVRMTLDIVEYNGWMKLIFPRIIQNLITIIIVYNNRINDKIINN